MSNLFPSNSRELPLIPGNYQYFPLSWEIWVFPAFLPTLFQMNNCAKLFWNPCTNVRSYGPDKLNLWPFYHLTFKCDLDLRYTWTNVSNAIQLVKENDCAKLFLNPCTNVETMAGTSSVYDHFIIWPSSVTLTFNLPKKCFKRLFYYSRKTIEPNYFEIHA